MSWQANTFRGAVTCGAGFLMVVASVEQAPAIPSPELLVGSISSLSQLGALLSALLGGGALLAWKGDGKAAARASPWRGRVLGGIALIAAVSAACNVYQWHSVRDEREARLAATLTRPARFPGQRILDPTLRELGAEEQARHPAGLTAAEAEQIIPRAGELGYEVIDIREDAEVEMGTFNNATAVRFPDLKSRKLDLQGKKALLICHNGNRSSETCQALAAQGIDCRFIVGGLERWISEGRSAAGFYRGSVLESRAIPSYANQGRLIDTPEARDLIERERAAIVDVRYPGEFELGHLPGAVNIPLRRMTTADADAAFAKLPKGPAFAACYDRRSCFFGEIAGLALSRRGFDYRGRYTVPWEYAPIAPTPPHVAAAIAERDMSTWARLERWLAGEIGRLAGHFGFLPVLLGLALVNRLLILPFAVKADRDQMAALAIEPEVRALKQRLADDPARRGRALAQLYRRAGLTPVRNLAALAALPMLMLASGALATAAARNGHALAIVGPLGAPDATLLLPLAATALISIYIGWALCRTRPHRLALWLLVAPSLLAAFAFLPGAVNLYVAASAVLLLAQRAALVLRPLAALGRWWRRTPRRLARAGIVRLADVEAAHAAGAKATRLGAMLRAGIPVPGGVVLTPLFVAAWRRASAAERQRLCRTIGRTMGRGLLAVRSSAAAEDLGDASYAGVYESVTDVKPADLGGAIERVIASFASVRAASYGQSGEAGAVIVQRMVSAERAGVLFTRAPDAPALALLEQVDGAGEGLVSGRLEPQSFRLGRRSGKLVGEGSERAPAYAMDLHRLGRRIEQLFGRPQDIEWAYERGRLAIVQARDITADDRSSPPIVLAEWEKALAAADDCARNGRPLAVNEMCEMLPRPTPATRSLIEALHAAGGSVDLACRALGLGYRVAEEPAALFPVLFGRLYHNPAEARRRAPRISRLDVRRIVRQAGSIERRWREEVRPATEARLIVPMLADFEALDRATLVGLAAETAERFVTETHVEAEIVNIAVEVVVGEARRKLERAGQDAAAWLVATDATLLERAIAGAASGSGSARRGQALAWVGHRATLDYELAQPRFAEDSRSFDRLVETWAAVAAHAADAGADVVRLPKRLARIVVAARRLQVLKEDAKHVALIELAVLRRILLALDRRLGLDGGIFLMTLQEIAGLGEDDARLAPALVRARAAETQQLAGAIALPPTLPLAVLERASWREIAASEMAAGELAGTRVAGQRAASGRAFVASQEAAERGEPLEEMPAGAVLVAPFIHPAWLGEVLRSGGVIAGSGGWLSHMAIVARERDIAMITGVAGWATVRTGATLRLGLDGRIAVEDEPAPAEVPPGELEAA